jgi:hypothetical protein
VASYLATVLADAPVHYWRMADPASLLLHDIGSSPIHLSGGAVITMPFTGIALDGGSIGVAGAAGGLYLEALTQGRPLTIEFWMWLAQLNGALQSLLYWDGNVANNVFCYMDATGHINLGGTGVTLITAAAAITRQAWHHIVGVFDNAATTLYVDGASAGTNGSAVTSPVNRPIAVGSTTAVSQVTQAFMSEVAIYGTALSSGQVSAHFAAQEVTQSPVFLGGGNPNNLAYGSGGAVDNNDASILAAVRRTYSNTP